MSALISYNSSPKMKGIEAERLSSRHRRTPWKNTQRPRPRDPAWNGQWCPCWACR